MKDDPEGTEIETELRRLRPAAASEQLENRIFGLLADPGSPLLRPAWWQRLGFGRPVGAWGWGVASPAVAATVALVVSHMDILPSPSTPRADASSVAIPGNLPPAPARETQGASAANVLAGALDEGVVLGVGQELVRRVRYRSTDHVQWRNPRTGAQWEVSYPREDVLLVPVNVE